MVLTDQLLAFSRQQTLRPRPVAINALLRETEPLLHHAVGDEITMTLALRDDVGRCLIDPTELQASMLSRRRCAVPALPDLLLSSPLPAEWQARQRHIRLCD